MTEKRIDLTKALTVDDYWYFFQLAAALNDILGMVQGTEAVEAFDKLSPTISADVARHLTRILQAYLITALTKFIYHLEPDKAQKQSAVREWIRMHPDLEVLYAEIRDLLRGSDYLEFKRIRDALTFHYSENDQDAHTKDALKAMTLKWEQLGRKDEAHLNLVLLDDTNPLLNRYVTADWMLHFAWAPMMGFDPTAGASNSTIFELSRKLLRKFVTFASNAFEIWCTENGLWIS